MRQFLNEKQILANRRNAQKSTGPTSPQGKAAVAQNALKTGIYSQAIVVAGESQEDFDALSAEYLRELQPASLEARSLVNELVLCEWRLRRFAVIETQIFTYAGGPLIGPLGRAYYLYAKSFSALQRQIDSTRRARDRAFLRLREIQPPVTDSQQPAIAPSPQALTRSTPATYSSNWVCSANSPSDPQIAVSAAPSDGPATPLATC